MNRSSVHSTPNLKDHQAANVSWASHSTGPFNPDWTFQKDKLWVCTQLFIAQVLSHDETRCFTGDLLLSDIVRFWRCCKVCITRHSALDFSYDSITSVIVDPADVTSVLKYSVTFWKFTFHHLRTFNCDHTKTFYIKPLESPNPPESLKVPMYICVSYVKRPNINLRH